MEGQDWHHVSLTRGSGRPTAPTSRMNVMPCCGSAALAGAPIPSLAVVTSNRSKFLPTKTGQLGWLAGTRIVRARSPSGVYASMHEPPQRAVETARPAAMVVECRGISDRHGIRRIDGDAMKNALAGIGEVGRCAIRRKADGVRDGNAGIEPKQFAAMKAIDRARALLRLAAHGPDPERAAAMDTSII